MRNCGILQPAEDSSILPTKCAKKCNVCVKLHDQDKDTDCGVGVGVGAGVGRCSPVFLRRNWITQSHLISNHDSSRFKRHIIQQNFLGFL